MSGAMPRSKGRMKSRATSSNSSSRQVQHLDYEIDLRANRLPRLAPDGAERGSQPLVAADQLPEYLFQTHEVQLAQEFESHRQVVFDSVSGVAQSKHQALGERHWMVQGGRRRLKRFRSAGRSGLEATGQRGNCRVVENRSERDFRAEFFIGFAHHDGGAKRIAANLEEVFVNSDVLPVEDAGPDRGQS